MSSFFMDVKNFVAINSDDGQFTRKINVPVAWWQQGIFSLRLMTCWEKPFE